MKHQYDRFYSIVYRKCNRNFDLPSSLKKISRSCWISFSSSVAVFYFSANLFFSAMSTYDCAMMIRFSKNIGETFDASGELSPLASNVSPLFFVLLLTRSIWKWIASNGSSQFLILLLGKTLSSPSLFSILK